MASAVLLDYSLKVVSENGVALNHQRHLRFLPGAGTNGLRQSVTLAAGFNALTVPSGAKLLVLLLGSAVSLTLKGITGDSASVTLAPASSPIGLDAWIPLGASPVVGILNGSASSQTIETIWL